MFDKMLEVGAAFDWISPLLCFAQDIANGPGHTFLISRDAGKSGRDIENLLRERGVQTWGAMVIQDCIHLRVKKNQARWAQYVLDSAGIPVVGGAVDPAPTGVKGEKSSPGQEGRLRK